MPIQFQLYTDARGEFRWRLLADNNRIVSVSSESYKAKADALNGIDIVRRWDGRQEIYQDGRSEWRWRLVHQNGKIIATGAEGYKAQADCEHGLKLTQQISTGARLVDQTTGVTRP